MCVGNGGGDSDVDGDGDGDAASGGDNDGDDRSLQASLKRAATAKLGASIESMMPLADRAWSSAGSSKMAAALQEGRERLAERKAEVGDEAALAELQASIRAADAEAEARAAASALLRGRPRLWLVGRDGVISEEVGAPGVLEAEELRLIPGSAGAVRRLRLSGKVAILSKPSAQGKGPLGPAELDASNEALRHQIATTARGGRVGRDQWDAIYVCEVTLGVGVGVWLALGLVGPSPAPNPNPNVREDEGSSGRTKPAPDPVLEALRDFECAPSEAVTIGDSWADVVAAQRAGCVGVLVATGRGAALGALLRQHGVSLPVTLRSDAGDAASTDFAKLQSMADGDGAAAAVAVEQWVGAMRVPQSES